MASLRALQLPSSGEPDYLQLRHRADTGILTARWQRPVNLAELRQGYAAALAAAEKARCPYWLVDIRSYAMPDVSADPWLTTEFLPLLPARLGTAVFLGVLLSPPPGLTGGPVALATAPRKVCQRLIVREFDNEGALTQWLDRCKVAFL